MAKYRRKRTIAMSRNSEENEYSVSGLDQLILHGIEEKLRSIVETEQ